MFPIEKKNNDQIPSSSSYHRTGRSSNRKRGLCHTPPPTVVTSIWLLTVVCQDLDSVEAMWIDYLPDYLSLKTYSPGAKCLHSFYLEVVSRIRVKQMRFRKTAYKLFTLIILSVTLVTCPAEFLQDSLKTYLQFVFSFNTWLVFHGIKNTTLRRKVTSFYFSSR